MKAIASKTLLDNASSPGALKVYGSDAGGNKQFLDIVGFLSVVLVGSNFRIIWINGVPRLDLFDTGDGLWHPVTLVGGVIGVGPGIITAIRTVLQIYNPDTTLSYPLVIDLVATDLTIGAGTAIAIPDPFYVYNSNTGLFNPIEVHGAAGFEQLGLGVGVTFASLMLSDAPPTLYVQDATTTLWYPITNTGDFMAEMIGFDVGIV